MKNGYGSQGQVEAQKSVKVPLRLRVGLPILAAGNVAILLTAHLSVGATTQVDGTAPFGMMKPHTASSDNLLTAVKKLADSGAYFMVIIVAILSGLWPYVKLVATVLVVALLDWGKSAPQTTHRNLRVLEVLGKYSFADIFLIALNFVIFRISTGTFQVVGQPLHQELWMDLHYGAVGLIIGVHLSAFLTHWAAFELHPSFSTPTGESEVDGEKAPQAVPSAPLRFWQGAGLMMSSLGAFALLLVGWTLPIISVDRSGGFLGHLIDTESGRTASLSIFSMSQSMHQVGVEHGAVHITDFVVFTFLLLTVITPLLEILCLLWICAAGARFKRMNRAAILTAELCSAIGCIELLLIVALISLFEMTTVVNFNMGAECKPYKLIMNNQMILNIAGLGFAKSTKCWAPEAHLQSGFGWLVAYVVLRTAAWRFVAWGDFSNSCKARNKDTDETTALSAA